ncbi:hypothetical protein Q9299_16050 [Gemmobacter fulvus]|uniref:hypothetical protein n=1 Tax=Gemmobacter fulvus TaxID=2840474 RepID=UPI0027967B0A|nr:hypothetical protein [Gemmobacter fulvus]MDQ1849807.1 hypothetical protein [Gemmobacter fulvus]
MSVTALTAELAAHPSILSKLDIAEATRSLGLTGTSIGRPAMTPPPCRAPKAAEICSWSRS